VIQAHGDAGARSIRAEVAAGGHRQTMLNSG
jgi:hypothetical protein